MIERQHVVKQLDAWLTARCRSVKHRQLVVISGETDWCCALAHSIIEKERHIDHAAHYCWLGPSSPESIYESPTSAAMLLGTEYRAAVLNACDGLEPHALLSVAGTVAQSGLLIVLTPDTNDWSTQLFNAGKPSLGFNKSSGIFAERFKRLLIESQSTVWIKPNEILWPTEVAVGLPSRPQGRSPFANNQQQLTAEKILSALASHDNVLISLTAKRGRGKSWLMGYFAKHYIQQGKRIALLSSQSRSTQQVFLHIDGHPNADFCVYHAPDTHVDLDEQYELIIIDEAASIPLPILDRICTGKTSVLLSTTVDGYEGTARGFLQRLLPSVSKRFNSYIDYELTIPIRWFENDPIEHLLDNVFCLNQLSVTDKQPLDAISIALISPESLMSNEVLLQGIYHILQMAHYQTTPRDLFRMLDASDIRIVIAQSSNHVVGAMLVIEEGSNALAALADDIARGARRPNGHMSAQLMCFQMGEPKFAKLRYLRVNRIAVEQQYQAKQIGTQMLNWLKTYGNELKYDAISTVFGDDHSLPKFWEKNDFRQFYRGNKKQKSSNHVNTLWVYPLSNSASSLFDGYQKLTTEQHLKLLRYFALGHRSLQSITNSLSFLGKTMKNRMKSEALIFISEHPTATERYWCQQLNIANKKLLKSLLQHEVNVFLEKLN